MIRLIYGLAYGLEKLTFQKCRSTRIWRSFRSKRPDRIPRFERNKRRKRLVISHCEDKDEWFYGVL